MPLEEFYQNVGKKSDQLNENISKDDLALVYESIKKSFINEINESIIKKMNFTIKTPIDEN